MLQAFIDDSREPNPPIFVLAGYLAPVDRWAVFAKEWQEILNIPPRIPYFKMSEIRHLLGSKANERIRLLHDVIERHILLVFRSWFHRMPLSASGDLKTSLHATPYIVLSQF
jgi:hypothetical protein